MSGPDWWPYDRFMPGDGDDSEVEIPREPGRIRRWWWRHHHVWGYVGPIALPLWLYDLLPDWIHRLAGRAEERYLDDGED